MYPCSKFSAGFVNFLYIDSGNPRVVIMPTLSSLVGIMTTRGFQCVSNLPTLLTELNECESDPCVNNATCNDLVNMYNCTCMPGWTGPICETGKQVVHNINIIIKLTHWGRDKMADTSHTICCKEFSRMKMYFNSISLEFVSGLRPIFGAVKFEKYL